MCGRLSNGLTWQEIHDLLIIIYEDDYNEDWDRDKEDWDSRVEAEASINIGPTVKIPVVYMREGKRARVDGRLYDVENVAIVHHVNNALKAHKLFTKDKDYIVRDGQVVLHKAASAPGQRVAKPQPDRFDAARGKADVKWRTQDLMALLRD